VRVAHAKRFLPESGCCFRRGGGRIFYFGPGHKTYPVYHHPGVQRALANAAAWAAGTRRRTDAVRDTVYSPSGWFER
jgi:trehalose utilization protein